MDSVFAAMRSGLLVADCDDGEPIEQRRGLTGYSLECVATHPAQPGTAFAGTFDSGLFRTTDAGATWNRVGADDIDQTAITSLAVDPATPDRLWVGTEPSRLYRSDDGGKTFVQIEGLTALSSEPEWSFPPRPDTHHVRWIEPAPDDTGRLYVGIEAGALVLVEGATDGTAAEFIERPPGSPRDNHTLATHPDAPERVYSAAGDGFALSTDRGNHWEHPQDGLDHRYVWGLAVDPGDPATVLVSAASGARTAHNAARAATYCYRKRGDASWERLDETGLPVGDGVTRPVLARGTSAGALYALSNRGLYRTTDGGDSWSELSIPWVDRFEEETARGLVAVEV